MSGILNTQHRIVEQHWPTEMLINLILINNNPRMQETINSARTVLYMHWVNLQIKICLQTHTHTHIHMYTRRQPSFRPHYGAIIIDRVKQRAISGVKGRLLISWTLMSSCHQPTSLIPIRLQHRVAQRFLLHTLTTDNRLCSRSFLRCLFTHTIVFRCSRSPRKAPEGAVLHY